jgi:hypothetical protein
MIDETAAVDFSLADLADLDATEIAELRRESLPNGAYKFAIESAVMTEGADKDNVKRFEVAFKMKVVECLACTERGVDKESLVGKTHTETKYIKPATAQDDIGYLRGWVTDIGCDSSGRLGGVAGAEPGFIDNTVGHEFDGKIASKPSKTDPTVKYARLVVDARANARPVGSAA